MYFINEDYEIFTTANEADKTSEMVSKRRALHNKMLKLHETVYPEVEQLGLSCHEVRRNIVTKIEPSRFTGKVNTWLLVRYGKSPDEIAPYKAIDYGFTKHACIQFGIFEGSGFQIDLFLGRCNGFDRQRIGKTVAKNREIIESAISALKGHGMRWVITGCEPFDIDDNDPTEFCDWLLSNDDNGEESFLTIAYDKGDPRLSEESIADEITAKIRLLLPLYNALTQRNK